jgi:SAM-dependent methyltransferase
MTTLTQIFCLNGSIPLPPAATAIINDYLYFLPKFCDLTKKEVLKKYVAASSVKLALAVAQRVYEKSRSTYQDKYGLVFPADAEVLEYAMERAKDREVCEIACATGENGLLLAYAGARTVTFNDISSGELAGLKRLLDSQPSSIRKKCDIVDGSALDLLNKKPSLRGRMGLVLCRNLLHFLRTPEQVRLLTMIQQLLAPDGQAIFVANSIYTQGRAVAKPLEDSSTASYHVQTCILFDKSQPEDQPGQTLCTQWTPCDDGLLSGSQCEMTYLYQKNRGTGFTWEKNLDNFKKLDKAFQKRIAKAVAGEKAKLQKVPNGFIRVNSSRIQIYNPRNLTHLFRTNGFAIISEFFVDPLGHLVQDFSKRFDQVQQIGLIVSKEQ